MTVRNRSVPRWLAPIRRGSAPALLLLAGLSAALASDGDLQRILLEHACIEPRVETVLKQASLTVYRVNCLGTAHKILDVACDGHRCSASQRRDMADRES